MIAIQKVNWIRKEQIRDKLKKDNYISSVQLFLDESYLITLKINYRKSGSMKSS
jgi:hypothetical protein